ncbi:hypothetical protein KKI24_02860 [bacterium]|nr:hypothetical protein [bacterium]
MEYRSKYTTKDINAVIDMIVINDLSIKEVENITGIGNQTIRRWLKNNGIKIKSKQFSNRKAKLNDDVVYRICFLYENYYSIHEVASITGLPYTRVRSTLIELEVPIRDRYETIKLAFKRLELIKIREMKRMQQMVEAGDDSALRRHIADINRLRQEEEKKGLPSKEDFELAELARLLAG